MNELRDISDRLAVFEERRALALSEAHVGIWDWDMRTDWLFWDEGMFRIYGITASQFGGNVSDWSSRVHPDDLPLMISKIEHCKKYPNTRYFFRFRLHPSIGNRVVVGVGNVLRRDGEPYRMVGINILEP